jgi:hypothetical protein
LHLPEYQQEVAANGPPSTPEARSDPPRANNVETDLLDSSRLRWAWKEME